MIKTITRTNQFKKDYKLALKQKKDISKLEAVLKILITEEKLPDKYKDHQLINYNSCRECHITPDWLIIYKIVDDELFLIRLGSHSELFNK